MQTLKSFFSRAQGFQTNAPAQPLAELSADNLKLVAGGLPHVPVSTLTSEENSLPQVI